MSDDPRTATTAGGGADTLVNGSQGRYTRGARLYDVASLEWPVYRVGRLVGLLMAGLRPGDRVLDVGCGTGLNLRFLNAAVGPTGSLTGIDANAAMLGRAAARVRQHGWANVRLLQADAAASTPGEGLEAASFDAVVFAYTLSVIEDSAAAWRTALALTKPGGRVAVIDLDLPSGRWATLRPLARLACRSGGAHYRRSVWQWVERDLSGVTRADWWGGHIRIATGTR